MTMYTARDGLAEGFGVNAARAVAGLASWRHDNDRLDDYMPNGDVTVTLIEFEEDVYWDKYGDHRDWHSPEEWAENVEEVVVDRDTFIELGKMSLDIEDEWEETDG